MILCCSGMDFAYQRAGRDNTTQNTSRLGEIPKVDSARYLVEKRRAAGADDVSRENFDGCELSTQGDTKKTPMLSLYH